AQAVPEARRVLVTAHNSLGYFAARYGFRIPGSARASLTTEASEPPAGRMAALVKDLRSARVPAVFPETLQSPKLMERLAAEAGVRLGPALYTGALGKRGTPGETYLKMMRHNVSAIVRALRP
ncbi:MAG: metal ABC transporter substrate-binding protein, partial [Nitrospinota bacterium]